MNKHGNKTTECPREPRARLAYCLETHQMALKLYDYILIHPIKWFKLYKEVKRRLKSQKRALA